MVIERELPSPPNLFHPPNVLLPQSVGTLLRDDIGYQFRSKCSGGNSSYTITYLSLRSYHICWFSSVRSHIYCIFLLQAFSLWQNGKEVARSLFKGLTNSTTWESTLQFFTLFCKFHPKDAFVDDVLVVILVVYSVMVLINDEKAKETPQVLETLAGKS